MLHSYILGLTNRKIFYIIKVRRGGGIKNLKGESTLIKTAIYNSLTVPVDALKQLLKEYGIEHHKLVDVKVYDSASDLLAGPAAHIYFLKGYTYTENNQLLGFAVRDKFPDALIVCMAEDAKDAFLGYRFHAAACLTQPTQKSELEEILTDLENLIKERFIIVYTKTKRFVLRCKDIQYINIVGRNLCYHLVTGETITGQTLRTAYKRYIKQLEYHSNFVTIGLSVTINLDEVDTVEGSKVIFKNGDIIYIAAKHQKELEQLWYKYLS